MKVQLLSHTVEPVMLIGRIAALSRDKYASVNPRNVYIKCIDNHHYSVLEHASFTFYVEGISRVATHQLVRHRHLSFMQISHRYTKTYIEFLDVLPDMPEVSDAFKACKQLYEQLLSKGVAAEDARMVLPHALLSKIVITGNLRAIREVLYKRTCMKAQAEIRELAMKIYEILYAMDEDLVYKAGPPCIVDGKCPESKPCGVDMKKVFSSIHSKYHRS